MNRTRVLVILSCLALSLVLSGCASADDSSTNTGAADTTTATPAAEPAPETDEPAPAGDSAPRSGADVYARAAEQFAYTLYEPTYLPEGFEYIEDESKVERNLVGIIYGAGDARLLIIQGSWDMGDSDSTAVDQAAKWGTTQAQLLTGIGFAWTGPAFDEPAETLLAPRIEGASYAIFCVDVPREELLTVGESMTPVR